MKTKRASIKEAVFWIAHNDEPGETEAEEIAGLISVKLVADLFGLTDEEVAKRVARERRKSEN